MDVSVILMGMIGYYLMMFLGTKHLKNVIKTILKVMFLNLIV